MTVDEYKQFAEKLRLVEGFLKSSTSMCRNVRKQMDMLNLAANAHGEEFMESLAQVNPICITIIDQLLIVMLSIESPFGKKRRVEGDEWKDA